MTWNNKMGHVKSRLGDNNARKLIKSFLKDQESYFLELGKAIEEKDSQKLHDAIHGVKGVFGVLCLEKLKSLCETIEDSNKNADWNSVSNQFDLLKACLDQSNHLMNACCGESQS